MSKQDPRPERSSGFTRLDSRLRFTAGEQRPEVLVLECRCYGVHLSAKRSARNERARVTAVPLVGSTMI